MEGIKVALVTGAASGMGRISVRRLTDAGIQVAALDVNEDGLEEVRQSSNLVQTFACNIASNSEVVNTVKEVQSQLGPIDRLTHAGAIMPLNPVSKMSAEDINNMMRINYEGTVNMVKAVLPEMEARNSGQIILFGSIAGTCPERNMSAYCASKAAVNMFAEILWKELENTNIKVLLVCPAITNTPLMRFVTDENAPNTLKNSLAQGKLNDPEKVVDAIDKALTKEGLICYPTPDAVYATRIRRFFPNYWWKLISKNS